MRLTERIFALHAVPPFAELKPEELLIIAAAASYREFAAGHVLCPKGGTLNRLYVRVAGELTDGAGGVMQSVVGTTLLLTGIAAPFAIVAGPEGYRTLSIPRGKFFTVVNECPALLVGFFRMPLLGVDYLGSPGNGV
jgi:hypothetical protein